MQRGAILSVKDGPPDIRGDKGETRRAVCGDNEAFGRAVIYLGLNLRI